MVSTDPISDMLTRIRNAIAVGKSEVSLPYSKIKLSVAQILAKNGFIAEVNSTGKGIDKKIVIIVNDQNANPKITEIDRMSRPGRRLYVKAKEIPKIKSGRGIVIISTPKGVMSGDDAKKSSMGGELICKVY
ncbi:MAG TPA: 30S ribosomal protein S8 [Candidatus Saccharimonadales bacterium]|nr:30S ribosomal protein S8 [Candidatus Saccharimonadales bacterium]